MLHRLLGDLPAAQHNAADRRGILDGRVIDHMLEGARLELGEGRAGGVGPQHRFGGHHDQGPLRGGLRLRAQEVEVLGRGRRDRHPQVAPRRQREEPLEAGRRVLRALPLVPVGQQQGQSGELPPLVLGRHHEVVDDDLGTVGEVAELRLPGHQGLRRLDGIAVLEADSGIFGEQGIAHGEVPHRLGRLQGVRADPVQTGADMGERHELLAVGVVDQHGMAMAEGAATGVLPGQPHVDALVHERADG